MERRADAGGEREQSPPTLPRGVSEQEGPRHEMGGFSLVNNLARSISGAVWNAPVAIGSYVWHFWSGRHDGATSRSSEGEEGGVGDGDGAGAGATLSPSHSPSLSLTGGRKSRAMIHETAESSPAGLELTNKMPGMEDARRPSRRSSYAGGHHRASSSPGRLSPTSGYLDDIDYGIKLVGRKATGSDAILDSGLIGKIHAAIPARFRLCSVWKLLYSTAEHGFSLATLYLQAKYHDGPTLIAVRDDGDAVFGVFATETWRPHLGHYGTGECFLWQVDQEDLGRVKKFGSTGANSYFMISEQGYLAAGCGGGKFGFWIDSELSGQSYPVPTFDNQVLASSEHFRSLTLELWGLELSME